jgi:outer membrane protein assembly factor BamB
MFVGYWRKHGGFFQVRGQLEETQRITIDLHPDTLALEITMRHQFRLSRQTWGITALLGGIGLCWGADWPQFLGPHRDNSTPETVQPWKGELKVLWRQPVGPAHSSPVVVQGVVYAFYEPAGKNADALAAFEARTGKRLWENSYERAEFKPLFGAGPRSTPLVHQGRIYTLGGTGILTCWNAQDGSILWKVDTLAEFRAKNLFFGVSTSPILIDGDKVVVMVGGPEAGIVAFEARTGKPVWKATEEPASYASPIVAQGQLIFLGGSHLLGLSPQGQLLWKFPWEGRVGGLVESSTTPVWTHDLVIGSTVTSGTVALRLVNTGKQIQPEKVWENKHLTCYFSTPVVVGDYLYMINGTTSLVNPSITLRCVEVTSGKIAWERKDVGRYHAALLRCGPPGHERLLMLNDNGQLFLLAPDPQEYKELARSKVCGPTWANPALAEGHLYLRDEQELLCIPLSQH